MLRIRVQEDVEKPFREKFLRLDEETDKYRTELNKLKYEYSFLKAEYEHEKAENVRIVEEMKMRHEAEVRENAVGTESKVIVYLVIYNLSTSQCLRDLTFI